MSKTLETKKKILGLLKEKDMTITGLGSALNLSTATVSQHVEDLSRMGAIERVENEHFRKLKYYRIRENANPEIASYMKYFIVAVVVLAVGLEFYFHSLTPLPSSPTVNGALAVTANNRNASTAAQPSTMTNEAALGLPTSTASVLNISKTDGFNFIREMFHSNVSSGCMLVQISACDNNAPSQFACLNSSYYYAYINQRQAAFSGQPGICPQYLMAGTLSCVSQGGYCAVAESGAYKGVNLGARTFWGQTGPLGLPMWEWAAFLVVLVLIAIVLAYAGLKGRDKVRRS